MAVTLNAFTFITANASQGENLINVEEVDEIHPLVDIASIIVDNTEVTQGDIVNLRLKILGDPQYIKQMVVAYEKTTGDLYWTRMEYNKDNECYEDVIEISKYAIPGDWKIYRIEITYIDGTSYDQREEFSGGSYTVFGTDGDDTIPTIDESTLMVSKDIVYEGDRVCIPIKGSADKSGVNRISVFYKDPEYKGIGLNYNLEKDVYEGYIDIEENTVLGGWKISQIYMEDNEENYIY